MKEVLLVDKKGKVFSDATETDERNYDDLVADILKQKVDKSYRVRTGAKDTYQNGKIATKIYQMITIMENANALIILIPETVTSAQLTYFVENILQDDESKSFHLMKYVATSDSWKNIYTRDLLDLYARTMGEKQNGLNR